MEKKTEEIYFYPSGDFRIGEFKGIPLLYHEGYRHYRNDRINFIFEQFGLKKYYLRHGDDGDWIVPVSIEPNYVMVNYAGCIFSPEPLDEFCEILEYKIKDASTDKYIDVTNMIIYLSEEEGEAIVLGEDIDFIDFLEVVAIARTGE